MLIVLEILVIPLFLTLGAQLQQVEVGMFSLLSIVAETLILVGKYLIYLTKFIVLIYQMLMYRKGLLKYF